ncbi:DNA mismatch repair endonuclease MutL [Pseudoalteromonas phenolica]|uniref:DNA mismatch repair endonuclease MutL n=1 Tax=Pseudoalteromonas phenolica TaxID=161398 RepID=UPI00110BC4D8|nr:DNA mismatch repair endonuclease MutL [Pseudoalteromonas phenolica]TMO55003.1 DNA mismatch repair endonuclease MutL [Pseudoalteromonas phenolica]
MSIEILPARLANQIAAGEVVERPASVVKELVENSIDAGANRITIDIERGGHKLIRIRDNGHGIAKDELTLALSRHATSKLKSLDDLECISSLGFRGEALASISSVSRLTLSSKPAEQETAWQAFAEGRDMAVQVQPTAHPNGTTIEVKDLFFNTPARRKFLRTEKTEFSHIDELVKRIALSRFDVAITLTHNKKVVRQYRARTPEQGTDRVAQVAGKTFATDAAYIESGAEGLKLYGWVLPCGDSGNSQYTYVNGRMMRDKLILHAIRQAFEEQMGQIELPGFVIYLELDPRQVDVNVHPAKHEVRFHQARLVHDFIVQAVKQAVFMPEQSALSTDVHSDYVEDAQQQNYRSELIPSSEPLVSVPSGFDFTPKPSQFSSSSGHSSRVTSGTYSGARSKENQRATEQTQHQYNANEFYQALTPQNQVSVETSSLESTTPNAVRAEVDIMPLSEGMLFVKKQNHILLSHYKYALLPLWLADIEQDAALTGKALLLPVRVSLERAHKQALEKNQSWLTLLGFDIQFFEKYIMVKKLPLNIYSIDVAELINRTLECCANEFSDIQDWLEWLYEQTPTSYFVSDSFTNLQIKIQNNTQCLSAIERKAVKLDSSMFKTILEQGAQ